VKELSRKLFDQSEDCDIAVYEVTAIIEGTVKTIIIVEYIHNFNVITFNCVSLNDALNLMKVIDNGVYGASVT
jgi:hypothetical protein